MSSHNEEFDLSDGKVASHQKELDREDLESRKDRRSFRKDAYESLKGFVEVYLVALFFAIIVLIILAACGVIKSPATMTFLGVMVGLMAGVSLSLAVAIRQMSADKVDELKKVEEPVTTAQLGFVKSIIEVISSSQKLRP